MQGHPPPFPELLTPAEVADMFRVTPQAVHRWARARKLPFIVTPGNQRRYKRTEVEALLRGESR